MRHPPTELEIGLKCEGVQLICTGYLLLRQPSLFVNESQILTGKQQLQGLVFRIFKNCADRSAALPADDVVRCKLVDLL